MIGKEGSRHEKITQRCYGNYVHRRDDSRCLLSDQKLLGEPDEELDDEYEDFDFDDEEEDAEDKSREYVTLDFEEDEQEASDEEESEDDEE